MATISDIRKSFVSWVIALTGYDSDHVIWSDQNYPKINKPFVLLKLSTITPLGHDYVFPPNDSGAGLIVGDRDVSLEIQCIGNTSVDPLDVLLRLHMSLSIITYYSILSNAGVAYVDDLLGPIDTSTQLDESFERRGNMDLLMRFAYSLTDPDIGVIESVRIEGDFKDVDGRLITTQEILAP